MFSIWLKHMNVGVCRPLYVVLCLLICLSACTENPLSEDAPSMKRRLSISGKISAFPQDTTQATLAYVWLQSLNLGTFTNAEGRFELRLPASRNKPLEDFTGVSKLYAYSGNFRLDSTSVVIHKGELIYAQGGLNAFGETAPPLQLRQFAEIAVQATPESMVRNRDDTLRVTVRLRALLPPLVILTAGIDQDDLAGLLIARQDTSAADVRLIYADQFQIQERVVGGDSVFWRGSFPIMANTLAPGVYQVIPLLWIKASSPPPGLLQSLGATTEVFDSQYGRIPFLRNTPVLNVLGAK